MNELRTFEIAERDRHSLSGIRMQPGMPGKCVRGLFRVEIVEDELGEKVRLMER
jgi:hypothetical protein